MASLQARLQAVQVLVVDGSPFQRALLCEALRGLGSQRVATVETAEQARAFPEASETEVLLLDWLAAPLDALTFTRLIRCGQTPFRRETGVLLVTTHNTASDVLAAQGAGVDEYLAKPFSIAGLHDRLQAVLCKRRPFVQSDGYVGPCRRRRLVTRNPRRRMADGQASRPAFTTAERTNIERHLLAALELTRALPNAEASAALAASAQTIDGLLGGSDDLLLRAASRSLTTYVQAFGARDQLDARVLDAHFNTIRRLIQIAPTDLALRHKVVQALDLLVLRKLQTQHASPLAR